jgi:hypothetical protein
MAIGDMTKKRALAGMRLVYDMFRSCPKADTLTSGRNVCAAVDVEDEFAERKVK